MFEPNKQHIILVLAAAAVLRVIVFALMPPTMFQDSHQYMELAGMLAGGDLAGYDGARTPGYPLLIAAFGGNLQALTVFQMLLGSATSVLLYQVFGLLTRDHLVALAGALAHALSPFQAVFERDILSESLSTFLTVLSVYFFFRIWRERAGPGAWLLMGLAAALAAFVRPMMQVLAPLVAGAAAVAYFRRSPAPGIASGAGRLALALLPAVVIIGGWSAYNYSRFDYPGLTTLAGFNLTNHSGAFIEKAPAEYADIAAIYLRHRGEIRSRLGTHATTIWYALPDLEAETGLSRTELSRRFGRLSLRLIRDNPLPYLRGVAKSFTIFWLPAWYTAGPGLIPVLRSGGAAERLLLWPLSLAHAMLTGFFLLLPAALVLLPRLRERVPFTPGLAALYVIVLATALLTSLMEYGENARYEQAVEPFVMGIGLYALISIIRTHGMFRREHPAMDGR